MDTQKKEMIRNEPITKEVLILLGYWHHPMFDYFCPPHPANGSTYRLEYKATRFYQGQPVKGTGVWRAYLPLDESSPLLRRLINLGDLNDFHKGMCGANLF